jgi:hypothetical protein
MKKYLFSRFRLTLVTLPSLSNISANFRKKSEVVKMEYAGDLEKIIYEKT